MKKTILNIGNPLSKQQQQQISGGSVDCSIAADCEACGGLAFPGSPGTCLGDRPVWICCAGGL